MNVRPSILILICGLIIPTAVGPAQESRFDHFVVRNNHRSAELSKAGVVPVQTVRVSNASYSLSRPFALDESHQIAVAWVDVADQKAIRVLYRSNSQCSWRMCDAIAPSHIGKGFREFDKQMPIDVTVALLRSCEDIGELTPWFQVDAEPPSQQLLARRLLELLTVDRDAGIKSGEVLTFGSRYVTLEYASMIPSVARPFSVVNGRLTAPNGSRVADPLATELPPTQQLPDYGRMVEQVEFNIPSYARFTDGDGKLTGRVYRSQDKRLQYFFVEDEKQRAMLASVEITDAPICILGLRTQYPDLQGMNTPLLEYGSQIPEEFGGRRKARYQLNWNWVRQIPIIQHYFHGTGRDPPAQ